MTARKRVSSDALRLGVALKLAMRISGLNQREMARRLGWDASTVSRLLSGTQGGQRAMVRAFLDQCTVSDSHRAGILALCLPCGVCGCLRDHENDEHTTTIGGGRAVAEQPKVTKREVQRLREMAGREIVAGNPVAAQQIQQLIQRLKQGTGRE